MELQTNNGVRCCAAFGLLAQPIHNWLRAAIKQSPAAPCSLNPEQPIHTHQAHTLSDRETKYIVVDREGVGMDRGGCVWLLIAALIDQQPSLPPTANQI